MFTLSNVYIVLSLWRPSPQPLASFIETSLSGRSAKTLVPVVNDRGLVRGEWEEELGWCLEKQIHKQ